MALCTVSYVRSKIATLLTDSDISDIIEETSSDILSICETTDETNPLIILAGKYAILAATLQKMKTTGELAASIKTPGSSIQNTADIDIDRFQKKADSYIEKYRSSASYSFSSPVLHYGFNCSGGQ